MFSFGLLATKATKLAQRCPGQRWVTERFKNLCEFANVCKPLLNCNCACKEWNFMALTVRAIQFNEIKFRAVPDSTESSWALDKLLDNITY